MEYRILRVLPATRQIEVSCEGHEFALDLPIDLDPAHDRAVHDFILAAMPLPEIERRIALRQDKASRDQAALRALEGRKGQFTREEIKALRAPAAAQTSEVVIA